MSSFSGGFQKCPGVLGAPGQHRRRRQSCKGQNSQCTSRMNRFVAPLLDLGRANSL